jgi:hypothetical protein
VKVQDAEPVPPVTLTVSGASVVVPLCM